MSLSKRTECTQILHSEFLPDIEALGIKIQMLDFSPCGSAGSLNDRAGKTPIIFLDEKLLGNPLQLRKHLKARILEHRIARLLPKWALLMCCAVRSHLESRVGDERVSRMYPW